MHCTETHSGDTGPWNVCVYSYTHRKGKQDASQLSLLNLIFFRTLLGVLSTQIWAGWGVAGGDAIFTSLGWIPVSGSVAESKQPHQPGQLWVQDFPCRSSLCQGQWHPTKSALGPPCLWQPWGHHQGDWAALGDRRTKRSFTKQTSKER